MSTTRSVVCPDGARIAWVEDDFSDPWAPPLPPVLLLHGIAESAAAFRAWVPQLARRHRVLRADLRGHGVSSPLASGPVLTLDQLAEDVEALVAALDVPSVHVVGAKLGAQIALRLAPRRPAWMASLTLAGVLISPRAAIGHWAEPWAMQVENAGVRAWAAATMPGRMGRALEPAALDHWATLMGTTRPETVAACLRMLPGLEAPADLERIACPTQVLVAAPPASSAAITDGTAFDQRQPVEAVRGWQQRIPGSRLVQIRADSYHVAATHPDACAAAVAAFIEGAAS